MLKDFKHFNKEANFFNKFLNLSMKEGLILSVSYNMFIEKLKNLLLKYIDEEYFHITNNKEEYIILSLMIYNLNKKDRYKLSNELFSLLNNNGYFISQAIDELGDKIDLKTLMPSKGDDIFIYFNKKFDVPMGTPDILYHVTTKTNYEEKIKSVGIVPKTQKMVSNDLDRVYLIDDINKAYDFCVEKRHFIKKKYGIKIQKYGINIDDWVILGVDMKAINKIKLYKDTKMDDSYYTFENIPPFSIRVEKEVNLKNKTL
jgi:hypothetical protein